MEIGDRVVFEYNYEIREGKIVRMYKNTADIETYNGIFSVHKSNILNNSFTLYI